MNIKKAVILVSGGMDSAVTMAIEKEQGFICHALSVSSGQRHSAELDAAKEVAKLQGAAEHKTVVVDLRAIAPMRRAFSLKGTWIDAAVMPMIPE